MDLGRGCLSLYLSRTFCLLSLLAPAACPSFPHSICSSAIVIFPVTQSKFSSSAQYRGFFFILCPLPSVRPSPCEKTSWPDLLPPASPPSVGPNSPTPAFSGASGSSEMVSPQPPHLKGLKVPATSSAKKSVFLPVFASGDHPLTVPEWQAGPAPWSGSCHLGPCQHNLPKF